MKKIFTFIGIAGLILSCESYSPEQGEAAEFMCECMSNTEEDPDILYFICNEESESKFDKTVFIDEGYAKALNEKCPELKLATEDTKE